MIVVGLWIVFTLSRLARTGAGRALERIIPAGAPAARLDFDAMMRRAEVLAKTDLVPHSLRGKPEAIVLVGTYGAELGVPLTTSLQQIDVIEGRPDPSAQLRVALIRRAGHEIRWGVTDGQRAVIFGRRREYRGDRKAWVRVEWTIDQARRAELCVMWVERKYRNTGDRYDRTEKLIVGDDRGVYTAKTRAELGLPIDLPEWATKALREQGAKRKDNWWKFPSDMLRARAAKTLSRMEFSDVLAALGVDPDADFDTGLDLDEAGIGWDPEEGDEDRTSTVTVAGVPGAAAEPEDGDGPEDAGGELVFCSEGVAECSTEGQHTHDVAPSAATEPESADRAGDPDPADAPPAPDALGSLDADGVRELLAGRGIKLATALRAARTLAESSGLDVPNSVEDLRPELLRAVLRHLEGGS